LTSHAFPSLHHLEYITTYDDVLMPQTLKICSARRLDGVLDLESISVASCAAGSGTESTKSAQATERRNLWRRREGTRRGAKATRTTREEAHDDWENIAGELLWVHNFHLCQVNNAKRLEIDLFYIWHICLGVGKLHNLPNKKCQMFGVALTTRVSLVTSFLKIMFGMAYK